MQHRAKPRCKPFLHGLLDTAPASDGGAHQEYVLTAKGRELFPVIVALRQWSEAHLFEGEMAKDQMVDRAEGRPVQPLELRSADGRLLSLEDILVVPREPKARKPVKRAAKVE